MKGIFYSTITVIFIIPMLVFTFAYLDSFRAVSQTTASKAVGDKIASFSKSIDSDLPRAVNIIAKRSIEANINHIESSGASLDDAESRIKESMTNGTVFGNSTVLNNFTISLWANILNSKGSAYGFDTSIDILSINITPVDSYHVGVGVIISVNMSDSGSNTNLYRVYDTTIPVSVEGLVDPLYLLYTNGLIKRTIRAPNITVYGATGVDTALVREFYMQSADGPSFLDRLEGRLTQGTYNVSQTIGLETFVYLPEIQANGLQVKTGQSSIDYLYFSSSNNPGQSVNNSAYSWLKMNTGQATKYGVTLV